MRTLHLASLVLAVPFVLAACDSDDDGGPTATVSLAPTAAPGSTVGGTLTLTEMDGGVLVEGTITGLPAGDHGFHVHTNGNCATGVDPGEGPNPIPAGAALGHYDALATMNHAGPDSTYTRRHVGDSGNATANASGTATVDVMLDGVSISGTNAVAGRAYVVHANRDDLTTNPGGGSGTRIGCGIITASASAD